MDALLSQMPSSARWRCAVSEDEEVVERLLDAGVKRPTRPPSDEWGLVPELLATVVDRLATVTATIAASAGVKANQAPPYPRPLSAVERVETRRAWRRHDALVAEVKQAQARG